MALRGSSSRSKCWPPSRLRQAPPSSTPNHTSCPSSGFTQMVSMRGRLTPWQNSSISGGRRCQVSPRSVDLKRAAREGAPVPAYITSGWLGSMPIDQTVMPRMAPSARRQWAPPSSLMHRPASAPAYTRSGRSGSTARARTTPSNSMASFRPSRCQVRPSSLLRRMPWPAVATMIVKFIARASLTGRCRASGRRRSPAIRR